MQKIVLFFLIILIYINCFSIGSKKEKGLGEKPRVLILIDKPIKEKDLQYELDISNDIIKELHKQFDIIDEEAQQRALRQLQSQQKCGVEDCGINLSQLLSADYIFSIRNPRDELIEIILSNKEAVLLNIIRDSFRNRDKFKYSFRDTTKENKTRKKLIIQVHRDTYLGKVEGRQELYILKYLLEELDYELIYTELPSTLKQELIQNKKCYSKNCFFETAKQLNADILEVYTMYSNFTLIFESYYYNSADTVLWNVLSGRIEPKPSLDVTDETKKDEIYKNKNIPWFTKKEFLDLHDRSKDQVKEYVVINTNIHNLSYFDMPDGSVRNLFPPSDFISNQSSQIISFDKLNARIKELEDSKQCSKNNCMKEAAKQLSVRYYIDFQFQVRKKGSGNVIVGYNYSLKLKDIFLDKVIVSDSGFLSDMLDYADSKRLDASKEKISTYLKEKMGIKKQ